MKRALCLAFLITLAGLGCISPHEGGYTPKALLKEKEPPPVVTEHGITEKNAAERAEALRRELEYDQSRAYDHAIKAPDATVK